MDFAIIIIFIFDMGTAALFVHDVSIFRGLNIS